MKYTGKNVDIHLKKKIYTYSIKGKPAERQGTQSHGSKVVRLRQPVAALNSDLVTYYGLQKRESELTYAAV